MPRTNRLCWLVVCSFGRFYNYKAQSYSLDACTTHVRPWELCVSRAVANDEFWYSRWFRASGATLAWDFILSVLYTDVGILNCVSLKSHRRVTEWYCCSKLPLELAQNWNPWKHNSKIKSRTWSGEYHSLWEIVRTLHDSVLVTLSSFNCWKTGCNWFIFHNCLGTFCGHLYIPYNVAS